MPTSRNPCRARAPGIRDRGLRAAESRPREARSNRRAACGGAFGALSVSHQRFHRPGGGGDPQISRRAVQLPDSGSRSHRRHPGSQCGPRDPDVEAGVPSRSGRMIRPLRTAGIQGRGHLVRLSVFLVLLGALALVVTGAPRVLADSAAVRVDRQAYIADTVVDPYSQDPNNVHVGVAGGKESARGFLHIDLSRLPQGSSLSSMLVTLVPSSSNTDSLNPSAASLSACILTKELPATFDRGNPPPFDCLRSQVNGHATAQGSWQFDLAPMASTWMQSGNTGAAIVPNAAAGAVGPPVPAVEQDWALSFTKTASTAVLIFAPLTTPPAGETQFGPSTNGPVLAPLAIPEMAPPVVAPTPPANTQPAPLPRPAAHPSRRLTR